MARTMQRTLSGSVLGRLVGVSSSEDLDEETVVVRHHQRQDAKYLSTARSIADKFLILCLYDDELRPLYAKVRNVGHLKARMAEALLAAVRFGELGPVAPMSLDAHKGLSEEHVVRLQGHLTAAAREHALEQASDAEALASQLLGTRDLVLALLPRWEEWEILEQAAALRTKGGAEAGRKVMGMELAPLRVPMKRREQTLACVATCSFIPVSALATGALLYFWRSTWRFLSCYLAWSLLLDRSPWTGGKKPWGWLRRCWLMRNFAEYFPASLIKGSPDGDFSGRRPMLVGYHPHGILSFGALCNIGSDATGWSEKFPHLTPRICTLNLSMKFPFLREMLLRLGFIAASKEAICAALRPGNAVVVVVGGAAEALDTKPGEYVLTLARRTGFFRLALEQGADLVPTFGFGENDIFDTVVKTNSLLRQIQLRLYKALTFSTPMFYGRNVFTYNMGPLPYRRPLTVVVGDPLRVEQKQDPTKQEVEELRSRYIDALRRLFEEWQPRLEPGRETPLIVV